MNKSMSTKIEKLLDKYNHEFTTHGIEKIIKENVRNKGKYLIPMLSQHPNWDAENNRIVFSEDYNREFDREAIYRFTLWAENAYTKLKGITERDFVILGLRFQRFLYGFCVSLECNIVGKKEKKWMDEYYPEIPCAIGTRVMKVIQRVCKIEGLDKVVDMQECGHHNINDGTFVSRPRDRGYNYQIAQLGDGINPIKVRRHTIVSVNILDFLTMSFGNGWASCHTIDKDNERDARGDYSGCFCSGTLSYGLDESTVIMYTVDSRYEGTGFETQDKINRVVFHIAPSGEVMIEGRVYPDGRDGGDSSLASQFRAIMQKIVADCWNVNNFWSVKKGISEISPYQITTGTHYNDYLQYDDCTISFLKGKEIFPKIRIGHYPICPSCGKKHEDSEWLNCERCQDGRMMCAWCGEYVDEYNSIYCEDTGNYYCCETCAERDGIVYCDDIDRWIYKCNANCDDYTKE